MHVEMHTRMQPMAGSSQQAGVLFDAPGLLQDRPVACGTCLLRKHGSRKHKPYGCVCGTKFTRLDALNRHITSQSSHMPQFPCDYCYNRQGENAFRRYDDLVQHLKGYHKIETADKLLRGSTSAAADGQGMGGAQQQQPIFECFNGYVPQFDPLEDQTTMQYPMDLSGLMQYPIDG
ncbi:hypothetical protein Hte_008299 [Hypoxylon texense]